MTGPPPLIRVNIRDDPSGQWLENSLRFSVIQAAKREAGAGAMLARLSGVVFAETLRRYVRGIPEGRPGWLAGARDPHVGRAFTATGQSVAQIACDVGYESEAALNRAFKREYSLPPARYRKEKLAQRTGARSAEA